MRDKSSVFGKHLIRIQFEKCCVCALLLDAFIVHELCNHFKFSLNHLNNEYEDHMTVNNVISTDT